MTHRLVSVMAVTAACSGGGGPAGTGPDASTADFVEHASFDVAETHLAAGDVDNDGDVDLYMTTNGGGTVSGHSSSAKLARNDGDGTLVVEDATLINWDCGRPRLEKVDADDLLDVVCLPQASGGATALLNQGQGAFLGAGYDNNTYATAARAWPVLAASPLVAATFSQGLVAFELVDTTQQMPIAMTLAPDPFTTLTIADLDGDGKPELIAGTDMMWSVFSGADQSRHDVAGMPGDLETADLNRDGHPDLLAISDANVAISLVSGGLLTAPVTVSGPPVEADHFVVDYDADGNSDLAFIGVGPQVYVMRGDGAGSLKPPELLSIAGTPIPTFMAGHRLAAVADFDHDGKIDLAISDVQAHTVRIWFGQFGG